MSHDKIEKVLEHVRPSRRDLLKRLLVGGSALVLVPISTFVDAEAETTGDGKGKAKGKTASKGKGAHKAPSPKRSKKRDGEGKQPTTNPK
jgi:hypothetical protein